jgi:hypothetical protein
MHRLHRTLLFSVITILIALPACSPATLPPPTIMPTLDPTTITPTHTPSPTATPVPTNTHPPTPSPQPAVSGVSVDPFPATIYGFCQEPNVFSLHGSITTDGPASVVYHWEIWKDGSLYHATADTTLVFDSVSTQSIDPGADHGDCGSYVVKLIVTSPNNLTAEQNFTIEAASVTSVTVEPIATVYGYCYQPNAFGPRGSITTDGPTPVIYHWEIWKDGSLYHATADTTLVFDSASTQDIDPGADHGDCGDYVVKLIVTSPNDISAQQSFTITDP